MQVDYVDTEQEVQSAGYPATLVTTKTCSLLSIATTDLLRFGSGVKEAVQTAAWNRRAALLDMQDRVTEANEELNLAVSSARSLPGVLHMEAVYALYGGDAKWMSVRHYLKEKIV